MSKTRRQKETNQVCTAFAYELLYSTIVDCVMTTVGMVISEASIVMEVNGHITLLLQTVFWAP